MPISETVTTDGLAIHFLEAGDPVDPTIVLLHGGIIDAAHVSWGEVIEPLAADCHVVAPDLLGYGRSGVDRGESTDGRTVLPPGSYPVGRHVDAMTRFLDELAVDTFSIAGLSLGGAVGLGVALRRPALVDDLLLIDSYGLGRALPNGRLSYALARVQLFNRVAIALFRRSRRLTKASLNGIVADLDDLSEKAVDAVYEEVKRPTAGVAFRRFREAEVTRSGYRTVYVDELPALEVPTRLLHGRHDEVVPLSWAERAADRIPESELVVLDSCAHWPPRERPSTVVEHAREVATR
ncbi:alpha/beta hydrolase [Halomicrobium sp. IBSBa]|uniref:alpha/beta fold hydrolase n=1 Tax=Halomicrobium sp. IBSBa TaxID=2778916 RepID=UPI001AC0008F|nr:alpha/beta hydrolase [Halomicrobium sp. IBSBa]MBO4247968.1 alpha/beta hydrolase [Halomicrobium sp. IBSBa]